MRAAASPKGKLEGGGIAITGIKIYLCTEGFGTNLCPPAMTAMAISTRREGQMRKASIGLMSVFAASMSSAAQARESEVTLQITARDPAYEGRSFGDHGSYERIRGIAHMRIDPEDPANSGIVDLGLAPRASDGMVEYDVDVAILRPANAARARRVMVYEVVNRGIKLMGMLNKAGVGMGDPIAEGDGFLMRQGYTMVWSGWQSDVAPPAMLPPEMPKLELVAARFPTPRLKGGSPVTGVVKTETVFDSPVGDTIVLPYPAFDLNQPDAKLTVQQRTGDPRRALAATEWSFIDAKRVRIKRPVEMDAGAIYRFEYLARDPVVMGLGFAATRDLVAWLRRTHEGNPLADMAQAPTEPSAQTGAPDSLFASTIAIGGSQSGRYIRDFLWQGFNRDIAGKRVFDGVIPFTAGGRRTFTNFRFAEPGRFSRQHEDHDAPGFDFPFAYETLADPVTGMRDGILARCSDSETCPRVFHVDTSAEFWQAGASLVGTGGTKHDGVFPDGVRAYAIAGGSHVPGMTMPFCAYPPNMMSYAPVLRALLVAMVDWTIGRSDPPPSRWPRLGIHEIVPVETLEAPFEPWARAVNLPIAPVRKPNWRVFVPAIGKDGNDLLGVRLPEIAAPTGTYLGWNLRKEGFAAGDLCMIFGSHVPFAKTVVSRGESDHRPVLDELYAAIGDRAKVYSAAAEQLVKDRFLLRSDAKEMVDTAKNSSDR
jgi:hypothetical protein